MLRRKSVRADVLYVVTMRRAERMAAVEGDVPDWLRAAVAAFGADCKAKLGPGEPEAAIRTPLETLITTAATNIGVTAVPHDEVRDAGRAVRPDYAISVEGAITGYVEVKRPGKSVDPTTFTGHDLRQWNRLRDLPNLVYTNGTEWRLWRDGVEHTLPVYLTGGPLTQVGSGLVVPHEFEALLRDFLLWKPATIRRLAPLVRAVAPLTRLLRAEVFDQLAVERQRVAQGEDLLAQPFTGLANDWRRMLFPDADDDTFANGYAQTVTFALLLAKSENISLDVPLNEVGSQLGAAHHTLMGRALQLLTASVAAEFKVTLDLLVRVVNAVEWSSINQSDGTIEAARRTRDTYLYLYEHFLAEYDPDWRKLTGSYYTPYEVVGSMVRLTEEALRTQLGKTGFDDSTVTTVDPAMGTGTYLNAIIETVAEQVEEREGDGFVAGAITDLAQRLIGFELQMGPYAVAELRTAAMLKARNAHAPTGGMRTYVTNTLDDPYVEVAQLGGGMDVVAASRRSANKIKADVPVTVVIGNPPYAENAAGKGGWIESGDPASKYVPMNDFRVPGDGIFAQNLKNLYVYFWRWGSWKVWDAGRKTPGEDAGVVCYISTSGYLRGPAFRGMREYLRRTCSAGWVIDLTPEGQTPDVPTRVFPGVRQPLAIGLFVRTTDTDRDIPADIKFRSVHGNRQDKFDQLAAMTLSDDGWRAARTGWQEPLTAAANGGWDTYPAMHDLFCWTTPGAAANRTWVIAPSTAILNERWARLVAETDADAKDTLFKPSRDATLDKTKDPLPGTSTSQATRSPLRAETNLVPVTTPYGYRSFDRQYTIADSRVWHAARPPLWAARTAPQVYAFELHSSSIESGPAIVFSDLIPDMHYFKGSEGGRVLPFLHPGGRPNFASGLLQALSALVAADLMGGGSSVTAEDLLAYIAAMTAHPGFTATFADELTTPGIRVPLTGDPSLWSEAVTLGRRVLWLHTYGHRFADPDADRPIGSIRYPSGDVRRILNKTAVTAMPDDIVYDFATESVSLGTGTWGPVSQAVFDYEVGGKNVLRSWTNYRKKNPGGRKSSPLDDVHVTAWPTDWTRDFTDLLSVLTQLVELEDDQADLLTRVLNGPVLSREMLNAEHGVKWPTSADERKPDYRVVEEVAVDPQAEGQLF